MLTEAPDWLFRLRRCATVAFQGDAGELTYAELFEKAAALAGWLRAQGVAPGDRVALLTRSGLHYTLALHGLRFAGAVLVPVNVRLAAPEVAWQLGDANCRLALCDSAHRALATAGECPVRDLEEALAFSSAAAPVWKERVTLANVQSIVYTSGTTGRPKGARLTYSNHLYAALASALRLGMLPNDRWFTSLPLFHVGGMGVLMRSVIYGTTAVTQDTFDPQRANQAIDDGATLASVVAAMLSRMFAARGEKPYPSHLRAVLLGGGPAPRPLLEEALTRGAPVLQSYGLTEANAQAVTLAAADAPRKVGSAGIPLPFTEVRIIHGEADAAPGSEGEIVLRSPALADGYDHNREATERAFRDGWFYTGDIGYLDDEGYLYVLDRRCDLIVSGGENVYPAEVEAALLAHPDILEAGVVGVADERYGEAPLAVLQLAQGAQLTVDEVVGFCRERLAGYKVPRHVRFADALPRNAAGKLLRKDLRVWL